MRRRLLLAAWTGLLALSACTATVVEPYVPQGAQPGHPFGARTRSDDRHPLGPLTPRDWCGRCDPRPAGPCTTGCEAGCVPCRCWPDYPAAPGLPRARDLLAEIMAIAAHEMNTCTAPPDCRECWRAVLDQARECATNAGNHALTPPTCHGMSPCEQLYEHVVAARAAARARDCHRCLCFLIHQP